MAQSDTAAERRIDRLTEAQCSTHLGVLCLAARALLCAMEEWQWRLADIRTVLKAVAAVPAERRLEDSADIVKADRQHTSVIPLPPHLGLTVAQEQPHKLSPQPEDHMYTTKLRPPVATTPSAATPDTLHAASAETAPSAQTHLVPAPKTPPPSHFATPTPQKHASNPQKHAATAPAAEHAHSWHSTALPASPLQGRPAASLEERTPTGPAASATGAAGPLSAGLLAHNPFARAAPAAMHAATEHPHSPEDLAEAAVRRQHISMALRRHAAATPPGCFDDVSKASQLKLPMASWPARECPSLGTPFELTAYDPACEGPWAVLTGGAGLRGHAGGGGSGLW